MSRSEPIMAHLEAPALAVEGRRQPRRALRLETSGEADNGTSGNVTVHNLSVAGLLLETELALNVGEVLAIDLPQIGPVGAEVVWQSGHLYGCAFEQALGEAALAAAQLRGTAPTIPATSPDPAGQISALTHDPLGHRLNRLRRENSLTLAQVADALGVSKPTVWAWEKGKARPLPERIAAIAKVLGVEESELNDSAANTPGARLVEECRQRLANAYGVSTQNIRIMIEV